MGIQVGYNIFYLLKMKSLKKTENWNCIKNKIKKI